MKLKIFCRCSLFPSWSGQGLISTPYLARPNLFGCFATYITYFQKGILPFRLSAYRLSFKVEAVGHFTWLRQVHSAPTRSLASQRPVREFLCMCTAHACSSVANCCVQTTDCELRRIIVPYHNLIILNAMFQRYNKGRQFLNHSSTRSVGSNLVLSNVIISTISCSDF